MVGGVGGGGGNGDGGGSVGGKGRKGGGVQELPNSHWPTGARHTYPLRPS